MGKAPLPYPQEIRSASLPGPTSRLTQPQFNARSASHRCAINLVAISLASLCQLPRK
jgi:hypothetical protein